MTFLKLIKKHMRHTFYWVALALVVSLLCSGEVMIYLGANLSDERTKGAHTASISKASIETNMHSPN